MRSGRPPTLWWLLIVTDGPPVVDRDGGTTALMQVIPAGGPTDARTEDLVDAIRGEAAKLRPAIGAQVSVTGRTGAGDATLRR